jgi:hypothetical protein
MNTNGEKKLFLTEPTEVFGKRIGFVDRLFGCWHNNLSRPFTHGKKSYLVCLKCGARKNFNAETLTSSSGFFYPPKPSQS